MLLATRPPSMQVNSPVHYYSYVLMSMKESGLMTLSRQVRPHEAQPCSGLQRRWHDHPRHRQRLQGRLFCALGNIFIHTCDDYTHCDGRSDTNCVEISSYEQSCDLHIIINTQTGSAVKLTLSIDCDFHIMIISLEFDSKNLSPIVPTTAASMLPQVHNQIHFKSTYVFTFPSKSPPPQLQATHTGNLISYHL